jgi:hypothetical protein
MTEESQQVQAEAATATATAAEAQHDKDELREQLEHRLQAEEGTSTKYEHTRFGLPMPFRVWNLMPQISTSAFLNFTLLTTQTYGHGKFWIARADAVAVIDAPTPNTQHPRVLISSIAACQSIIVHAHSARTRIKIPLVLRLADTFTGGSLCASSGRSGKARSSSLRCPWTGAHKSIEVWRQARPDSLQPTRRVRSVRRAFTSVTGRHGTWIGCKIWVCWTIWCAGVLGSVPINPIHSQCDRTEAVRDSVNRNIMWMHEMVPGQTPNALVQALPPDPSACWPLAAKADMGVY